MSKILSSLLALLILPTMSCSKSTNETSAQGLTSDGVTKELSEKLLSHPSLPQLGDTKKLVYYESVTSAQQLLCRYWMTEQTTVTGLTELTIDLDSSRSIETFSSNASSCPSQPPNFTSHGASHKMTKDYVNDKMKNLREQIGLERFFKFQWVSSAELLSSKEVQEQGLRAQLVEINVTAKSGLTCRYRQYFSLDSVFLGRFREDSTCGPNSLTNFQRLIDFTIASLPKK